MKRTQTEPILLLNSILNNANYEVMHCILVVVMIASEEVSGRRDSNPRPSAWEADALPLSYSRVSAVMAIDSEVLW